MANRLKMAKVHSIQTLHARGWSQRRIARALGVHRETVARYVQCAGSVDPQNRPNPPTGSAAGDPTEVAGVEACEAGRAPLQNRSNLPTGSTGPASRCEPFREVILAALERGLSYQRIWQDLKTEDDFLRCLENAFQHFGGVPQTLVIDNLKAAVTKADWFEPDLNPKIVAFCEHYGTVVLPTKVRTPRHKGKVERGVAYVQDNALKRRTFPSLQDQNRHLLEWETSVADTRIHGTTRRQAGKVFAEVERAALLPLPIERFPCFREAQRIVNPDGHVEVAKAYYSAPPEYVGRRVWARWDGHVVRIFDRRLRQIAIHAQHEPGRFATDDHHIVAEKRGGIERGTAWWLRKARSIGPDTGQWAEAMLEQPRRVPGTDPPGRVGGSR